MAKPSPIPPGMRTVTPHLVIRDCAKAIAFYQRALGAEEVSRFPAPDGKSVWHAALRVGDSTIFMSDRMGNMGPPPPSPEQLSPASMWLYVPDCDASFRRAVEAGGKAGMPPADMFWGDRVGSVVDPFGYSWTFATHVKDMSEEEMRRAGEEFAKKAAAQR